MELIHDRNGKRTKHAVALYKLSTFGWSKPELEAFEACETALAHQVNLSNRDKNKPLCVYTDASDTRMVRYCGSSPPRGPLTSLPPSSDEKLESLSVPIAATTQAAAETDRL